MAEVLPETKHLALALDGRGVLTLTLNRPEVRNAMSMAMVEEIEATFVSIRDRRDVRVVVMRGAGGHFCAGGDIRDMAMARGAKHEEGEPDPAAKVNRAFGRVITTVNRAPQAVVALLEGAVLGGGFGLSCVADVAIAKADTKFGLPETGLGLPPAQIAPFLVQRLGPSEARRLAVTGGRFDGHAAKAIGLVHTVVEDDAGMTEALEAVLAQILRCAPGAIAATKRIVLDVGRVDHDKLLDAAADRFAEAVRGPEGIEGTTAFIQKRKPNWAPEN